MHGAPAFVLACIGTDNKFCAEDVQKRWSYILSECKKRDITVLSFGADGVSRELKSMQLSVQLFNTCHHQDYLTSHAAASIPVRWKAWFLLGTNSPVTYVQDTVHIGTKLRSRILTPSILLPLGKYVAGAHHLQLVKHNFSKDQHALRQQDIDCKDKQNYESVQHITSNSVLSLLTQLPDATGTLCYLKITRAITDIETCEVHCDCRMPFEGETMVCCDQCDRWYHENCTNVPICSESAWFCQHCIPNK